MAVLLVVLTGALAAEFLFQDKSSTEAGPLTINATLLPLDSDDPSRTHVGKLRLLHAWNLTSNHPAFGGISSIHVSGGRILALSDNGILMGFAPPPDMSRQFIAPLPVAPKEKDEPSWRWDSESMQIDPASGHAWVGFELIQRICRYSSDFARLESCVVWPRVKQWPDTAGMESLVRLPDGRFLAIAEGAGGLHGGNDALLFSGDPADPSTPQPVRLDYMAPEGYRPTDAVSIGGNRILVLNRRVKLLEGFTAVLSLVDLSGLRAGAVLKGQEIARFAPPILTDNLEALSLEWRGDHAILWMASDDNHMFFQRSLLLSFELPPGMAKR